MTERTPTRTDGVSTAGSSAISRRERIRAASGLAVRPARGSAAARTRAVTACADADPPTVFVSYSRQDAGVVRPLVEKLRNTGARVTWDQDFPGGADFEKRIRASIDAAVAVIVVWSPAAAASAFVRDEARLAARGSKLVSTHVAGFDVIDLPLGMGHLNAILVDDFDRLQSSLADFGIELDA